MNEMLNIVSNIFVRALKFLMLTCRLGIKGSILIFHFIKLFFEKTKPFTKFVESIELNAKTVTTVQTNQKLV